MCTQWPRDALVATATMDSWAVQVEVRSPSVDAFPQSAWPSLLAPAGVEYCFHPAGCTHHDSGILAQ